MKTVAPIGPPATLDVRQGASIAGCARTPTCAHGTMKMHFRIIGAFWPIVMVPCFKHQTGRPVRVPATVGSCRQCALACSAARGRTGSYFIPLATLDQIQTHASQSIEKKGSEMLERLRRCRSPSVPLYVSVFSLHPASAGIASTILVGGLNFPPSRSLQRPIGGGR